MYQQTTSTCQFPLTEPKQKQENEAAAAQYVCFSALPLHSRRFELTLIVMGWGRSHRATQNLEKSARFRTIITLL